MEHMIRLLLKKCWEDLEVRRLLYQLLRYEMPQEELCGVLEEVAAYCLGESDDLPTI
jgi:hypothetical protein